jgi:cobalt-zinc-cadmium efflux system protein
MTAMRASTEPSYADCSAPRQRGLAGAGHSHGDSLGHDHGHDHGGRVASGGLKGALVLTTIFLVAEVAGGLISNSLTLLADAGHMFTDVGALAFSLFVVWLARQPATSSKTYGFLRWEILAALLNGAVLLAVSAGIVWEAIQRLRSPEPVETGLMFVIGVLGDLLGSAAAIVAALFIRYKGWAVADPIASIVMTLLIVRSSWSLVRESVDVLLEAAPSHIDLKKVHDSLQSVSGVESVHDLHVWTLTSGVVAMSAHALVPDPAQHQLALESMTRTLAAQGIHHVTIQLAGSTLEECEPDHSHSH